MKHSPPKLLCNLIKNAILLRLLNLAITDSGAPPSPQLTQLWVRQLSASPRCFVETPSSKVFRRPATPATPPKTGAVEFPETRKTRTEAS